MQFTWSAPDQVDLPFLVGKRQVVGNFLAQRAKKNFWGVNLRCRKDFACFLGKKCRICPSFQENMQDLANFLGRNVGFVGNFVARRAKKFLGVNMRCRKDFAVGKEIRTSRKITKQRYKHITPAPHTATSHTESLLATMVSGVEVVLLGAGVTGHGDSGSVR